MKGSSSMFFCYAVVGYLCIWLFGLTLSFPQQNSLESSSSSNGTRAVDSLKFVAVVASHGNVAPAFTYSSNPYPPNNTNYWPFGAGEVTKVGRNKLYNLGKMMRTLYDGFVDAEYSEDDFVVKSPEVDRTTISGQLFAAGLYPPVDYEIWNTKLLWQPILVDVDSNDKTLEVSSCARFVNLSNSYVSKFENKYAANISNLSSYVTKSTGATVSGAEDIATVWEMLYSQKAEGLRKISWATEEYFNKMGNFTGKYYIEYFAGSDEAVKLVIGTLFGKIMTEMKKFETSSSLYKQNDVVIDDGPGPRPTGGFGPFPTGGFGPFPTGGGWGPSSNQKMIFYSGFNASLITLQAVLGMSSDDIVSPVTPGSAMIFELHENTTTKEYYVQILWVEGGDGTEPSEPVEIDIPDCGTLCDLTTFVSLTEQFSNMTSYDTECETSSVQHVAESNHLSQQSQTNLLSTK